eukprot:CAMPEP_0169365870 /NCGR_PEP_ID=MMETSP1017-20121227/32804_1 /TAXON_ID=342587 /ORGANISM="Karlodinium micrum, Strain CCMP2283" /LENGTH=84 /DNA_ID=CAMNT_0009463749 /DNA_START=682 /DNA_END=938 /DNA_ORIENTATION=-
MPDDLWEKRLDLAPSLELSAQQRNEKIDEGSRLDSLQEEVEELDGSRRLVKCAATSTAHCVTNVVTILEVPGKDSYSGRLGTAI